MAVIRMDITFTGKGTVPPARTIVIDPDELPMGLDEDMQAAVATGDAVIINTLVAEMIGLSHDEFRHLKKGDFKRIMAAMKEAQSEPIPNG
jgi:hypothetical protein